MKTFLGEDFLLADECSRKLYKEYAVKMPIIDYHCHLPPADIANNSGFKNIAHAWLGGDHYKWRVMRANGIAEHDITGHEPDYQTFLAWAKTLPKIIGNPLYHWAHLELQRYFNIDLILNEKNAAKIWDESNAQITKPEFGARNLLMRMNVRAVGTTDDPADSLEHHTKYSKIRKAGEPVMVPSFRPDKALAVDDLNVWKKYINVLGQSADLEINNFSSLINVLDKRHQFFHSLGARASDHGLIAPMATFASDKEIENIFAKLLNAQNLNQIEIDSYKTAVLLAVGRMNAKRGWAMQLHLSAIRNLNTLMFNKLGPDTGYDAIADEQVANRLAQFLNVLQQEGNLPKTVLYSLNPNDMEVLTTIMGCFQDGVTPGKMQLGSAWWFNDHIDGMRRQMLCLANGGLISRFVGMLTDSRSFLSFPRHEYFRRILCGIVGGWMEAGEIPADFETFGLMVQDICYNNARNYFQIPDVE